ncbi:MAG: EVE domain-containing protein [Chloroflexi bacterium]|nr:EVE domain-containing protein [Chloroflexota bacterium]
MSYWLFQRLPHYFDHGSFLARHVSDLATFHTARYRMQIKAGDTVLWWKARGPTPTAELLAVCQVVEPPALREEFPYEHAFWTPQAAAGHKQVDWRTVVRIIHALQRPVPEAEVATTAGLASLSLFQGVRTGTVWPVSEEQGATLLRLALGR